MSMITLLFFEVFAKKIRYPQLVNSAQTKRLDNILTELGDDNLLSISKEETIKKEYVAVLAPSEILTSNKSASLINIDKTTVDSS